MDELGLQQIYEGRAGRIYIRCGGFVQKSAIGLPQNHTSGIDWKLAMVMLRLKREIEL